MPENLTSEASLEIEFPRRAHLLIALITLIAVLLLAGVLLLSQFGSGEKMVLFSRPTPTASAPKVVADEKGVQIVNQSAWQIEGVEDCLPQFSAWLNDLYPVPNLTVVVTDTVTDDMVVVVRQSGRNGAPDAAVAGTCEPDGGQGARCTIAIQQGEPSPNLDVAATVEMVWLVQEFYRPRTRKAWNQGQSTGLAAFRPLIHQEGEQWQSDCLHLTR